MTYLTTIPGSSSLTAPAAPEKAHAPRDSEHSPALQKACSEFESFFIYHLMKEMRASIPDDGYLGKSTQSETYTSLHDIEIARRLSEQGGIGLADFLMRQLADRFDENTEGEVATQPRTAGLPMRE